MTADPGGNGVASGPATNPVAPATTATGSPSSPASPAHVGPPPEFLVAPIGRRLELAVYFLDRIAQHLNRSLH